jgi:hypothetical protein
VQPSVAGVYDGLYVNGKEAGFPASATEFEPQQLLVIGGDYSYNSRYGQNYVRVVDSATFGGYIEGNKVSDLSIAAMYGSVICNPMTQQGPTLALVQQDPTTPSMNLLRFPNSIIVRGYEYGTGIKQAGSGVSGYTALLKTLVAAGSSGEVRILPTVAGGVSVESGENLAWGFGSTVRMGAIRWSLGSFGLTNTSNINFLSSPIGVTENDPICSIINGGQYGEFSVANGGGANAAATFFKAPKNSVTLRSINAGGTVNASGADYAEYERNNGLIIAKGDLVGFKADGTLTHIYEESIRFGIKSTNPSYVGGDTWGNEESLGMSKPEAQSDDFDRALESARQQVDRIAYSGKVPCNVLGASPGGYIIASEEDSRIVGKFVYDPDFEQYKKAVGRVNRILEDGRCEVAVMVH